MVRKTSRMIFGLLFTSTLCIAMHPSLTRADDRKNYAGFMCIRETGSGGTPAFWAGGIVNDSSTSWLNLRCPVIKDVVSQGVKSGQVRMMDRHFTLDISCTLVSARLNGPGGHSYAFSPTITSGPGGDPNVNLRVGSFTNGLSGVTSTDSHYELSCSIPPTQNGLASMISSYSITENGQSD